MGEVQIAIRWSDMDAYGHVNNGVYLNYLEEARDRLAAELFGEQASWDFVLAHVGIEVGPIWPNDRLAVLVDLDLFEQLRIAQIRENGADE